MDVNKLLLSVFSWSVTVLKHTGVSSLDGLIEWFYRSRKTANWRSNLADLAKPLREAAEDIDPDPWAYRLISKGANDLFYAFETANKRIQCEQGEEAEKRRQKLIETQPVPLILEGGLFESSSIYIRRFLNGIYRLSPSQIHWKPIAPDFKPVVGALALAICGKPFLPEEQLDIFDNLRKSAKEIVLPGGKLLWFKSHLLKEVYNVSKE